MWGAEFARFRGYSRDDLAIAQAARAATVAVADLRRQAPLLSDLDPLEHATWVAEFVRFRGHHWPGALPTLSTCLALRAPYETLSPDERDRTQRAISQAIRAAEAAVSDLRGAYSR